MRLPVVVLALLVLLPLVHAGTQADPEIVDSPPLLDAAYGALRGDTTLDAPEINLVAAWFDMNETTIEVTWEVVNASHRFKSPEALGFSMGFDCNGTLLGVDAYVQESPNFIGGTLEFYPAHLQASVDGNLIHVEVPRSALAAVGCSTVLRHTIASSLLAISTTDPNFKSGGGSLWFRDRAPDVGYGRDFALT